MGEAQSEHPRERSGSGRHREEAGAAGRGIARRTPSLQMPLPGAGKPLQGGSHEETWITSLDALACPNHLYRVQVCKALGAEPAHSTPQTQAPGSSCTRAEHTGASCSLGTSYEAVSALRKSHPWGGGSRYPPAPSLPSLLPAGSRPWLLSIVPSQSPPVVRGEASAPTSRETQENWGRQTSRGKSLFV